MITLGQGATTIPVRSVWLLLIYASELLDELRAPDRDRILAGDRDNDLLDAIAEVLIGEVEQRLRRNLSLHYQPRSADLNRVRGRIDHLRSTAHRLTDRGRIACRFDELSVNSARNRWIAHTLLTTAPILTRHGLARRCRDAAFRMHRLGVSPNAPTRSELSRDRLAHHDRADRRMLDAAQLVQTMAIPANTPGGVDLPALRHDDRLHRRLFESAVRGFFRHTLSPAGWTVTARTFGWHCADQQHPTYLPQMKTDVTLDNPSTRRRVIIETKFTDALVDRHDKTTIKASYVYQLHAYLTSQSGRGDDVADTAEGVLLFVKTTDRKLFTGQATINRHPIRFISVDLCSSPAEIRARWMLCLAETTTTP